MRRFTISVAGAALAAAVFSTSASATSLSLEYLGSSASKGYRNLKVLQSPVDPIGGGALPDTVAAGGFSMRDTTANSAFGAFVAWCLDLSHWLGTSAGVSYPYKTTTTPFSSSDGLTTDQQARIQGLFDAVFDQVDPVKSSKSSAFQIALWEVMYDDDYSLSTGAFQGWIKPGKSYGTRVTEYLALASSYNGDKKWDLTYLESLSGQQNLVTASAVPPSGPGPSPVPLPAAGWLLIGGLAGLGALSRRRKG